MKASKTVIKAILVLPLVWGLFFSWFLAKQNQVSAQTASLVATVRINPLEVEVVALPPVSEGEQFKVEAKVKNLGGTKIKKTKAVISFFDSGLDLKGKSERKLGVILGKESKVVSWRVTAREAGNYVILVEARGIEEETRDLVEASDNTMVEVQTFVSFWRRIRKFLARA